MLRTSNPALSEKVFGDYRTGVPLPARTNVMTLDGTVTKTGLLLLLLVAAAGFTWKLAMDAVPLGAETVGQGFGSVAPFVFGGLIVGLVAALVTVFKQTWAPFLAPVYAIAEGLFLGGVSAVMELAYPGIVFQAVLLTFGVLAGMLVLYRARIVRATEKFKLGVLAATGGICLVYAAGWILGMFGIGIPYIHESGLIGIGFSVFVVVIAALNLVLDFDLIERGVERGAPKHMEWYGGFALLVTLVWLYLEILRLLAKLQSRDR